MAGIIAMIIIRDELYVKKFGQWYQNTLYQEKYQVQIRINLKKENQKFPSIAVEQMFIQQKYQTMYFDNYLKPNPSNITQKFDQSQVSSFNHHSMPPFEPIQFNQRPYFNPRAGENTSNPSPTLNKNIQQPPKHYVAYQTGPNHPHIQRQQSFQVKNNISFNSELPNSNNNRDTNEFIRRRESITQNTFLRSNQGHSPSNNKSFVGENGNKNSLRMTMNNELQKNMQQGHKNNGSSNNLSGIGFNEQDYGMMNKDQKDKIQQKTHDKSGYFTQSNYSQYGFSESRVGSKPYALGFKSGIQNLDIDSRKGLQPNPKQKPLQQKQLMYNYQLKNTTGELSSFGGKPTSVCGEEYKYYTPSLAKKGSLKDDSGLMGKNGYSQVVDVRHNNNMLEREANLKENGSVLTDRDFQKSPSFDALLGGTASKDNFRTKLQSTLEANHSHQYATSSNPLASQTSSKQSSQQNITPRNNNTSTTIDNHPYTTGSKPSSQTFLVDPVNEKIPKQSAKNYHALIQNLEKKFSQQKKSSETFEVKEKNYLAEINKKDEKIKRQETIIDNNKETINALDDTIKQLRKKLQNVNSEAVNKVENANSNNLSIIEQLKRENGGLKEELKKQRKRSVSIAEQTFQKEILERQEMKIKQLQKSLIEANNGKQTLSQQLAKLKESTSSVQENYCQEIKEHQKAKEQLNKIREQLKDYPKTKEQLQKTRQQVEQLNCSYKQKVQSFNQVKALLQNLQQKYEGSLKKILSLQEEFQQECCRLKEKAENERKEKLCFGEENQQYKAKVERLQGEIEFKTMKIKTLEDKISEKQTELQNANAAHHKAIFNNELSLNQTISICIEETKVAKEKLLLQQQAYEKLCLEINEKNNKIHLLTKQNSISQHKISSLEEKIHGLQKIVAQKQVKVQENPKTTSDSAEINTLSSQSTKQSLEFKEILSLLQLYHSNYTEVINLFNLNHSTGEKTNHQQSQSLIIMQHQSSQLLQTHSKSLPSRQYLIQYHPLLVDQVKKILKDMKKLLGVLKQCESESQLKTQRLHELDKTFKKQANKINQLLGEIHLKNMTIVEINHMQVEKDIFRLNEKYQILNHVGLGEA